MTSFREADSVLQYRGNTALCQTRARNLLYFLTNKQRCATACVCVCVCARLFVSAVPRYDVSTCVCVCAVSSPAFCPLVHNQGWVGVTVWCFGAPTVTRGGEALCLCFTAFKFFSRPPALLTLSFVVSGAKHACLPRVLAHFFVKCVLPPWVGFRALVAWVGGFTRTIDY
mgnify:CR=1 FL=1